MPPVYVLIVFTALLPLTKWSELKLLYLCNLEVPIGWITDEAQDQPGRDYGSMCWFRWEICFAAFLGKKEVTAVVLPQDICCVCIHTVGPVSS